MQVPSPPLIKKKKKSAQQSAPYVPALTRHVEKDGPLCNTAVQKDGPPCNTAVQTMASQLPNQTRTNQDGRTSD